jgi:formylglycine-generating enzyme
MVEWPPVAFFGPRRGSAKNGAGSFHSETDLGCSPSLFVGLLAVGLSLSACKTERTEQTETTPVHPSPAQPEMKQPESPEAHPRESKTQLEPADFSRPALLGPLDPTLRSRPIAEQQAYLLKLLSAFEAPSEKAQAELTRTITSSSWLGFGNPKIAEPALTQAECQAGWRERLPHPASPECGHRNMVRIAQEVCIDQYEFPNVLCEYPVVWTRSSEAAELCSALGKRLCDAHEWEGACTGEVLPVAEEYAYSKLPKGEGPEYRRARRILMEGWHNQARAISWAYGPEKNHTLCGTGSRKSASCNTVDYGICGTNDYPAGSFPACHSKGGVYDQHGNVAEHMSFPLYSEQLGGRGYTEMKGSWFLFAREETHPDDCRWRAKNWHTTKVADPNSHRNYHLGFRCCADITP